MSSSYLCSVEKSPSLNCNGWLIDQSLFMDTQLGTGEAGLSCLIGLQHNRDKHYISHLLWAQMGKHKKSFTNRTDFQTLVNGASSVSFLMTRLIYRRERCSQSVSPAKRLVSLLCLLRGHVEVNLLTGRVEWCNLLEGWKTHSRGCLLTISDIKMIFIMNVYWGWGSD